MPFTPVIHRYVVSKEAHFAHHHWSGVHNQIKKFAERERALDRNILLGGFFRGENNSFIWMFPSLSSFFCI
jgi:hypothetical protein